MEFPENLTDLTSAALDRLRTEGRAAIAEFSTLTDPTVDALSDAETVAAGVRRVEAEIEQRADVAARAAALRDSFSETPAEPVVDTPAVEPVVEPEVVAEAPAEEAEPETPAVEPVVETAQEPVLQTAALGGERPVLPASEAPRGVTITAGSDVPGFSTGGRIDSFNQVAESVYERFRSFAEPMSVNPSSGSNWRPQPVAAIRKNIPNDLMVKDHMTPEQAYAVIQHAIDETRLPQKSLVASGGWCSPSEVLYDLCEGETTDGILSLPEVGLPRGGMKFTMGPDWADIYGSAAFFAQTEAQAISGTTKGSYEIPCPSWTDIRLDAVGFFFKAPVLTNAAYPELIQRWLRGGLVAHQHKKNARRLTAMATALGTAQVGVDTTSFSDSLLDTLDWIAVRERSVRRRAINQVMEVVLPIEAKPLVRMDMNKRTGRDIQAITDQMILAEFAARNLSVQFVYGWQDVPVATPVVYPTTIQAMIYAQGTFVEGTADVLNLSTMYDATALAGNIYTAAFFEEGQAIIKTCYGGALVTIANPATGTSGLTGAAIIGSS